MNVLIVEDESHTASLLKEIIEKNPDFMVIQLLESVTETVAYLGKYQQNIDLVFLDIELADGQSFEIFKHIDVQIPVIFCTAYEEYTLQAIKNNGIDYVLKPFQEDEIAQALSKYTRLRSNFQEKGPISFSTANPSAYQQHFLTQHREKSLVKKVSNTALFLLEHETLFLYTLDGERFPLYKKLEYVESVCDPQQFFRINRQMLINRTVVLGIEPYFNRKVVVHLSISLPEKAVVSRLKVSAFKQWLEQ